jgi:hypothetical protein
MLPITRVTLFGCETESNKEPSRIKNVLDPNYRAIFRVMMFSKWMVATKNVCE